jgi:two-component system sensor histidine kinase ChiS
MVIHPQLTNVADVVDETSHLIEQMVADRPIEFVTEISPDLPNVYSDRLRLRQIIYNMLSNAAKFTRAGTIRLSAYPDNGNVVIQVADTGVGINEQRLPIIFEQFESTGLADAGHQYGPGLSMPITKSLVELHGGQVNVESHLGQGTTFTVTLPVQPEL